MLRIFILLWIVSIVMRLCGHGQVSNGLVFCHSESLVTKVVIVIVFLSDFIFRYYVELPSIVICGQPSATLADKLEKDEKARIAAQVERLGPDGLKKAEADLEAAKLEHGKVVPTDLITSFPVPDMKCVSWHSVQSVQEPGTDRKTVHQTSGSSPLSKYVESDGETLPFFVQYDHIEVCTNSSIYFFEKTF